MGKVRVAVHGGASSKKKDRSELTDFLDKVANSAKKDLENGVKAVDVVEESIRELESNSALNAGYGAKLQLDGVPRPEAGIMKDDLSMGVAIGLENVKYPISVSRKIMEKMSNNIISSNYSNEIASNENIEQRSLVTHRRAREWWHLRNKMGDSDMYEKVQSLDKYDTSNSRGTVGCVVIDKDENLCAGTSTGGRLYQSPGRIGDTPIVGSGFYCDKEVAVSTTGVGEAIMKTQLARRVREEYNTCNLNESASNALDHLKSHTEGDAGLIAIDSDGEYVADYNSEDMIYSVR